MNSLKNKTKPELIQEIELLQKTIDELKKRNSVQLQSAKLNKNAESDLIESEARLSTLMSNVPGMAYQCRNDEHWTMVFINEACEELTGYQSEQLINNKNISYNELIHPDDKQFVRQRVEEAFCTDDHFELEYRIISSNGEVKWVWERGVKRTSTDNGSNLIEGVIHDITRRKQAEEILKNSEERFRAIVTNTEEILFMIDKEGIFTLSEGKGLAAMGLSPGEVVGQSAFKIYDKFPEIIKGINSALSGENYLDLINVGDIYFDIWYSPNKDSVGNIIGLLGMAVNVTDKILAERNLKFSEERFRSVIESATDSIISVNEQGIIIGWNNASENMFGFSNDEVLGKNITIIIPKRFINYHTKGISRVGKNKQHRLINKGSIELIGLRKDGSEFPIELSLSTWEIGKAHFFTALIRDITERQKTEDELSLHRENLEQLVQNRTEEIEEVNEQLKSEIEKKIKAEKRVKTALKKEKEVNELKTRFISTVSHELRTPLTAIKSSAELLKRYEKRFDDKQKSEQLDRIVKSVDYLVDLSEDVLMMGRTESGKILFSPKLVDIDELIKSIVVNIGEVDNNNHLLSYVFKGENKNIITDSKLVGLLVTNLVNNATKYSLDNSEVQISVTVDKFITIEVADEGIGIPAEAKKHLFEPFYRAGNAEKTKGSGLGLSIVKRSVELLKGKIEVESKINEGSKFVVKIPIEK